jgi:hypothetical protein
VYFDENTVPGIYELSSSKIVEMLLEGDGNITAAELEGLLHPQVAHFILEGEGAHVRREFFEQRERDRAEAARRGGAAAKGERGSRGLRW